MLAAVTAAAAAAAAAAVADECWRPFCLPPTSTSIQTGAESRRRRMRFDWQGQKPWKWQADRGRWRQNTSTCTSTEAKPGSNSIRVEDRTREMAFSRDLRACQTTPGDCDVVSMSGSGSYVDTSRCAPGRSSSRRRLNWRRWMRDRATR